MKPRRTRRWAFVEQEAKRLVLLGLTPRTIAKRLGVNKATVNRWFASNKLSRRRSRSAAAPSAAPSVTEALQSPAEWAATIRKDFALDATDDQLVALAQMSLELSHDHTLPLGDRDRARARFQSIVKQLALAARSKPEEMPATPTPPKPRPAVRRARGDDPRVLLMRPPGESSAS